MAYVHILTIVLCACFIQDAFSAANNLKGAAANGAVATRPPVRRVTTVKQMMPRKAAAVQAPPPPPPPPKYPHLTAVNKMFWDAWEDLNRTNANGKLGTRAVRNSVGAVLADGEFWSSLVSATRRKVKVTNDRRKADGRVRLCNAITAAITSPVATQGFQEVANEVYDAATRFRSNVGTDALRLVNKMVEGGEVNRGLDVITAIVTKVRLSPAMLIKGFTMLRNTLNLGGAVNMSGGMAKSLMSISSKFK